MTSGFFVLICPFGWWEQRESNPRPSACKADALNQLSYAPDNRNDLLKNFLCSLRGSNPGPQH